MNDTSDNLTRTRQDQEHVVVGLQRKFDGELKHLKETIERHNATLHEKVKCLFFNCLVAYFQMRYLYFVEIVFCN